jgi:hypothetical protein
MVRERVGDNCNVRDIAGGGADAWGVESRPVEEEEQKALGKIGAQPVFFLGNFRNVSYIVFKAKTVPPIDTLQKKGT